MWPLCSNIWMLQINTICRSMLESSAQCYSNFEHRSRSSNQPGPPIYHLPLRSDPFTTYHLPFTDQHHKIQFPVLPLTTYHLPTNTTKSNFRIYHLPFTIYRPSL